MTAEKRAAVRLGCWTASSLSLTGSFVGFLRESIHPVVNSSELTQTMSTRQRIGQGVAIFNQGRPGSQVNQVVNAVSGPRGLNMSGPTNHRNDLGFRAGNAIGNAARGAGNAIRGAVGRR